MSTTNVVLFNKRTSWKSSTLVKHLCCGASCGEDQLLSGVISQRKESFKFTFRGIKKRMYLKCLSEAASRGRACCRVLTEGELSGECWLQSEAELISALSQLCWDEVTQYKWLKLHPPPSLCPQFSSRFSCFALSSDQFFPFSVTFIIDLKVSSRFHSAPRSPHSSDNRAHQKNRICAESVASASLVWLQFLKHTHFVNVRLCCCERPWKHQNQLVADPLQVEQKDSG